MILVILLLATASCFPSPDLQGNNTEPSCRNRPPVLLTRDMPCQCDAACSQYGDCCRDSLFFIAEHQKVGASLSTCEIFGPSQFLMISSCPPDWKDQKTRELCAHPDTSFRDPLLDSPVTSLRTNVTYRNWHCASCHRDTVVNMTEIWFVSFKCNNWMNLTGEKQLSRLVYDTKTSSWNLNLTDYLSFFYNISNYLERCEVSVQAPDRISNISRTCYADVVETCPPDWSDDQIKQQCEAYTELTCSKDDKKVYRNYYCGVCNSNGTFNASGCEMQLINRGAFAPSLDFSLLLDWHRLQKRSTCMQETERYDPLSKSCRKVFTESTESMKEETTSTTTSPNKHGSTNFRTCPKIRLDPDEYIVNMVNNSVFIPVYNRTFGHHEYRIENDSSLSICLVEGGKEDEPVISMGLFCMTVIGISLSILFLVVHLLLFFLTPKLRNLSSMNLASLSVALLMVYCGFFAAWQLTGSGVPCVVFAVVIYYSLISAYCWMLTIAYDISRVLRESTSKLMVTSGKHWRRFALYSAWSWLVPGIFSAAALSVQFTRDEHDDINPAFGWGTCWFNNGQALLVFCVIPLSVVMLLNVLFFCWSAFTIYTTTSETRLSSSNTHQDFRLYMRLAFIMGLTWITGLVGSYTHIEGLWYVFVVLNSLQGVFIFLAFSCSNKVWNDLSSSHSILNVSRASKGLRLNTLVNTSST